MAAKCFHRNLRRLMAEKDVGVNALAAKTGINASQISHYRRGDNEPDAANRAEIARALGVTVDELEHDPAERKAGQPMPFGVRFMLSLGYKKIEREDLPADWQGRYVPIVNRIAAGPGVDTVEAEAFGPGDASQFVEYRGASPTTLAVEVVGDSMRPDFRPCDLVIADMAEPVEAGLAVVIYLDASGDGIARLKRIRRNGRQIILESINPTGGITRLPADRLLRTGRVLARLPFVIEG
jgi:SOS-response transcriptional repressor LexA